MTDMTATVVGLTVGLIIGGTQVIERGHEVVTEDGTGQPAG